MIRWHIDGDAELVDGQELGPLRCVIADVRRYPGGWTWRLYLDGEARRAPTRKAGIAAVEARIIEIAEAIKAGAR